MPPNGHAVRIGSQGGSRNEVILAVKRSWWCSKDVLRELERLLFGEVNVPTLFWLDGNAFPADRESFPIAREGLSKAGPHDRAPRRAKVVETDADEAGFWPRRG